MQYTRIYPLYKLFSLTGADQNHGLDDVQTACIDSLKGLPDTIESVYPHAEVQLCIVHMVRNSLKLVSFKDHKEIATDLKSVYRAATIEQTEVALTEFAEVWHVKYPLISKSWRNN